MLPNDPQTDGPPPPRQQTWPRSCSRDCVREAAKEIWERRRKGCRDGNDYDRTRAAVRRQLRAMATEHYDVAIGEDALGIWHVVLRGASAPQILDALTELRRHNARGLGVHVRPSEPHGLVFVDDVELATWQRMIAQGYEPAVVVQSSRRWPSYQLWMRHRSVLPPDDHRQLAGWFARRAQGDGGAVACSHWGRLAGFTNRKPEHRGKIGLFPYVLLARASGRVYAQADRVVAEVLPRLRAGAPTAAVRKLQRGALYPLEKFHEDERYGGDLHRAELGWADHAAQCGLDEEEIVQALLSGRDLSKKGPPHRREQYARRTARKALAWMCSGEAVSCAARTSPEAVRPDSSREPEQSAAGAGHVASSAG